MVRANTVQAARSPARVLHVITGLGIGGAEGMLLRLLAATDRARFSPAVVALRSGGELARSVAALAPLRELGLGPRRPLAFMALPGIAESERPDLVQGWMYHGNLAALLVRGPATPLLWGVRQCADDLTATRWSTSWLLRVGARLSHVPARIVYNSRAAAEQHEALGYRRESRAIIPNGFDCERFVPRPGAAAELRSLLGVTGEVPLVGLVGRRAAAKDHDNFLDAARLLAARGVAAHHVLVGPGMTDDAVLRDAIRARGLDAIVHLLAPRADIERVLAGLDVLALSSASESFPNVVGEAMACGVPCAVTDVGEAKELVGDTGVVVPPRDGRALADALAELLSLRAEQRAALGARARQRILEGFSLEATVRRWEALHDEVLDAPP